MITFVIPGDLNTPTGGYVYDRRIIAGLRGSGTHVDIKRVSEQFPFPDQAALREAARELAAIPDGTIVVVDGLAGGAMPDSLEREARRLRLLALVHHPLAKETGLLAERARQLKASEMRGLEFARGVIVTSPATADTLAREFGVAADRVHVIVPGTDRSTRAAGSPDGRTELLCVASVTPRKGHLTLIRALALLKDLDWRLTCVGSLRRDPIASVVKSEVEKSGLVDLCVFEDELMDPTAIEPFYHRADVFVLPTEYEGYGMAVAEALAHGIPVISTPTGGIDAMVGSAAGILVAPGDVPALANALRRVMTDNAERDRLREGAWRTGSTLPTWEDAARRFAAVLSSV